MKPLGVSANCDILEGRQIGIYLTAFQSTLGDVTSSNIFLKSIFDISVLKEEPNNPLAKLLGISTHYNRAHNNRTPN